MVYEVKLLKLAKEDILWFKSNDKKSYLKCIALIESIILNPRTGIGKPERLKHFNFEVYSRRVNKKDRVIYTIYEDKKLVHISSCIGHYND